MLTLTLRSREEIPSGSSSNSKLRYETAQWEPCRTAIVVCDMTDTMYDPRCAPFVSHFRGTELVVGHIETHLCPSLTSDQIVGGQPFRFREDAQAETIEAEAEKRRV